MPSNIEIKARVHDAAALRQRAERLSDTPAQLIPQHDTFFACPNGRLKLRQFSPDHGELIFYNRADVAGTKQSNYTIVPTPVPDALRDALAAAYGVRQTVVKARTLFMSGQTRIHLDAVEGLGDFMELEVVLTPGRSAAEGHATARDLMSRLGIRDEDLLEGAYADLLENA